MNNVGIFLLQLWVRPRKECGAYCCVQMYEYVKLGNIDHFNKISITSNASIKETRMGEYLKLNLVNQTVLYKK